MDWVRGFYSLQAEWLGIGRTPIGPEHREKANWIRTDAGSARVLELGCGGGQTAAAIAQHGHHVTAVELCSELARQAERFVREVTPGFLEIVAGDFYDLELPSEHFDFICYFDGFGIGSDKDQQRLLQRIAQWLAPDGEALIEIYTPWYWAAVAGTEMQWPGMHRKYDYQTEGSRMLDSWWKPEDPRSEITQSLRCYAPRELEGLLSATGLALTTIEPGGAVDYRTGTYTPEVPLDQAMQYLARLVKPVPPAR